MKQAWIHRDHEVGNSRDEFGGTHIYEDSGKTLAQDFPEAYFQCPIWAAWILQITEAVHGWAQRFVGRYSRGTPESESK